MEKIKSFISDGKNIKYFIFAALFILYFWGLGSYGLMNVDEGRYAEIPREMIDKGDFITPTLNYVLYFEKPVLHYWQTAAAFLVFGQNEFAARFFPALLGFLGVFFTWLLAKKTYGEERANVAACVLGTGVLHFTLSRVNITDMTLSFYTTLSLCAFWFYFKGGSRVWVYVFYAALALAVLAKGLVGAVLPGGIIFWFMVFTRRRDILKKLFWTPAPLLFFIVCVPWFYLVCKRNPDFFRFFFIQEHFLRYATKMHDRYEPFWFFIPVVLGGIFPWTAFLFTSFKNMFSKKEDALFLTLWFFIIFIFYSLSGSKLIPYMLPLFPPLAVIIAGNILDLKNSPRKTIVILNAVFTFIAAAFAIAAALVFGNIVKINEPDVFLYKNIALAACVLFALAAAAGWFFIRRGKTLLVLYILFAFLFTAVGREGFKIVAGRRSTKALMTNMLKYVNPRDTVVIFDNYDQDVPFYLKRRVIISGYVGELEYGWQNAADRDEWFLKNPDVARLADRPLEPGRKMYFIVRTKYLPYFPLAEKTTFIERSGKRNVYVLN